MSNGRCVVCGKNISGKFYTTDRNQKFCGHHGDPTRCRHCSLILPQGETMPCRTCLVKGFKNTVDATASIHRVLNWLETEIGPNSLIKVPVVMDDGANFFAQQGGVTNWTYDGYTLNLQIGILQYSQAHMFEPILAHEYGHVLLIADPNNLSFTGGIGQHRLQEEEGFCEVLRYLWVTQASSGVRDLELRSISENTDPVYGDGFRLMWPRYQAAGSIMNLRNQLLGLAPVTHAPPAPAPAPASNPGWPFGKKKKKVPTTTVAPPSQPLPPPVAPPVIPQLAPGQVIEGGSHRPTLVLDFLQQPPPASTRPTPVPAAPPARPVIDMSPNQPRATPPTQPKDSNSDRPTIRFDD